jgi:hypothetical protein
MNDKLTPEQIKKLKKDKLKTVQTDEIVKK